MKNPGMQFNQDVSNDPAQGAMPLMQQLMPGVEMQAGVPVQQEMQPGSGQPSQPTGSVTVQLQKYGDAKLGIILKTDEHSNTIWITGIIEGLVSDWNAANPAKALRRGDRIVAVNGKSGQSAGSAEVLYDEMASSTVMELLVELRGRWTIRLQKHNAAKIGARFHPDELNNNITITGIVEGLISAWNAQNPGLAVRAGDSITAVNGKTGNPESLFHEIESSAELELLVERARPDQKPRPQTGSKVPLYSLGDEAQTIQCPNCRETIKTQVEHVNSAGTYACVCLLCCGSGAGGVANTVALYGIGAQLVGSLCISACCTLWPCFCQCTREARHFCPKCKEQVGEKPYFKEIGEMGKTSREAVKSESR